MRSLAGRVVLEADAEVYRWDDVLAGAMTEGGWNAFELATREGVALAVAGRTADAAQVAEAERAWRRERRLLAASELKAWLAERSLGIKDLRDHLSRSIARATWKAPSDLPATEDLPEKLRVDAVCSGELLRFAEDLADRAAAKASLAEAVTPGAVDPAVAQRLAWVLGLSEQAAGAACARERELAAAFATFRERRLTAAALSESVDRHRLDWVVVECLQAGFDGEHPAAEAAMCIREGEADLEEVARRARVPVRFRRLRVEEAEDGLRAPLLSAKAGEVVGPVAVDGRYEVLQLVAKTAPTLDDPAVHHRAHDDVLRAALRAEVSRRVIWHESF